MGGECGGGGGGRWGRARRSVRAADKRCRSEWGPLCRSWRARCPPGPQRQGRVRAAAGNTKPGHAEIMRPGSVGGKQKRGSTRNSSAPNAPQPKTNPQSGIRQVLQGEGNASERGRGI